jgi:amino acid transporter
MLANNPYIQFIIMIGLAAGAIAYFPVLIILLTRDTFAWSFDRLIPAKFAEVNDRWGTPIFNIAFNFALCWIYMVILTYFSSYFVTLFATTWDMGQLGLILVPLSLAFLPLRKSLWETSPLKKYVILAIPVVSIIGILGAVEPAVALWIYSTNPYMGFGLSGLELLIASFVTPFVLYWVIRAIRHRQGLDVTLISRQIPPE